jgi:preprotein translocase subunit SecE
MTDIGASNSLIMDRFKIIVAAALLIAGVAGFYYFSTLPTVARVGMVLVGIAAAVAVGWFSAPGRQFAAFARDAIDEVKKMVWPTRKESFQIAAVVFAFVVVMAAFLWIVDKGIQLVLYDLILGWRSS